MPLVRLLLRMVVALSVCVLALLSLQCHRAEAQTGSATIVCTPPTQNTDGSPIAGTISYVFLRAAAQTGPFTDSRTATGCSYAWTGLAAGTHYFVARATVGGVTSANSNVASMVISAATPNPPGVPVPKSVAGPVFAVQTTDNALVLPQVGTVIAGRDCDPSEIVSQRGNTYMRIPVSSVTLLPGMGAAGLAVFGTCL